MSNNIQFYGNEFWNAHTNNKNKRLFAVDKDNLKDIESMLKDAQINYYAYTHDSRAVFAIDKSNEEIAGRALQAEGLSVNFYESQKAYAPKSRIIGEKGVYDSIDDKRFHQCATELALNIADKLEQRGIQFSGRVYPNGRTTLTVNGSDIDIVKDLDDFIRQERETFLNELVNKEIAAEYETDMDLYESVIDEREPSEEDIIDVVTKATELAREEEYAVTRREKSFAQQVDDALAGNIPQYNALKVCDTPKLLLEIGCNQLPVLYTQKHLNQALQAKNPKNPHLHGLTEEQIKKLPELIENPAMIYDSLTQNDSVILALSETDSDSLPLIVSVKPNGKGTYELEKVDSNFITSLYGKDNFASHVEKVANSGNLLYWNKEKSQELFRVSRLQLPGCLNSFDSDIIIRKSRNIVNSFSQNSVKQSQLPAQNFAQNQATASVQTETTQPHDTAQENGTAQPAETEQSQLPEQETENDSADTNVPEKTADNLLVGDRFSYHGDIYEISSLTGGLYPNDVVTRTTKSAGNLTYTVTENIDKYNLVRDGEYLGNAKDEVLTAEAPTQEEQPTEAEQSPTQEQETKTANTFANDENKIDEFLSICADVYNELYNSEDSISGYDYNKAIDVGEKFMRENTELTSAIITARGDYFSSDREMAAFAIALAKMGVIDKELVKSVPTITCEWSESADFEKGKTYSVSEFDRIMRNADSAMIEGKNAAIEYYGSEKAWNNAELYGDKREFSQFIGYDKTKFTVNLPNGETITDRQDIGDGYGGVVDFLKTYSPRFDELVALLEETIRNEAPEYYEQYFSKTKDSTEQDVEQTAKSTVEFTETALSDFEYDVNTDGNAIITSYTGTDTDVVVPSEIDGHRVMKIGKFAFGECISPESVTISDGVTNIGEQAFAGCTNLKSVTIPNSVISIDEFAFSFCESLKNVTILDGVTSIDKFAFMNCESLESLTIPDSVKEIDVGAFAFCTDLKSAEIPADTKVAKDSFPKNTVVTRREKSFAQQVDDALAGKISRFSNLKVCDTPQILLDVGCKQLPMLYTQQHLRNAVHPKSSSNTHWHGLTAEQIKKIPELIEKPALVFDSISKTDSIVMVLNAVDNDNAPIFLTLTPNGRGLYELDTISSNFITSIYGKDNSFVDYIEKVANTNNILFCDKQKSQELFSVLRLQLSQGLNNLDFDTIIHKSRNIVNSFSQNSVKQSQLPAQNPAQSKAAASVQTATNQVHGSAQETTSGSTDTEAPQNTADSTPQNVNAVTNFRITDDSQLTGKKAKFKANADAIRTLKTVQSENRPATDEEKHTMSLYSGWGGIQEAFDDRNASWNSEYAELKELLTPDEYRNARSTVLDAFYTSNTVIDSIYKVLDNAGFKGGNVLDKTIIRLIQKHDNKSAVKPPFLGGFFIFGASAT